MTRSAQRQTRRAAQPQPAKPIIPVLFLLTCNPSYCVLKEVLPAQPHAPHCQGPAVGRVGGRHGRGRCLLGCTWLGVKHAAAPQRSQ